MSQNRINALPAPLQAPPCLPSVSYNINMLQNVCINNTNINTRMSVPSYSKQFEINHSCSDLQLPCTAAMIIVNSIWLTSSRICYYTTSKSAAPSKYPWLPPYLILLVICSSLNRNAITEILTNMLVSMSTLGTNDSVVDNKDDGVPSDNKMPTTKQRLTVHDDREDPTFPKDVSTYEKISSKSTHKELDNQEKTATQSFETLNISRVIPMKIHSYPSDKKMPTTKNTVHDDQEDQEDLTSPKDISADIKPTNKNICFKAMPKEHSQSDWASYNKTKERKPSPNKSRIKLVKEIKNDMSQAKIHQLIVNAVKDGKYKQKIVPMDLWDFGGQKDYYMTHQLFITSRGIFVLMFNGSIDLHKHMPELNFLPGHFGKATVAVYLLHWVNSILTYCKRTENGFPKIIFVATHKDEKWFEWTREDRRRRLEEQLQQLFESHAGLKHLEFQPLIFVDATNPNDPEINQLRQKIMQRATEHPRWGEPMPTRWIPLELQLAQKSAEGVNILSRDQLLKLNSSNESMTLSEKQIETFLRVQHSLGKLLYFNADNLRDFIIISPAYLVEVLRSIVTEEQFWPKGETFSRILKNLREHGIIERSDIYHLWQQEHFQHILPYKEYMLHILVHLDVIIAPRTGLGDLNSPFEDVSRFLLPCMITKGNDTMFLERFWQSSNSIIMSYTFIEEVIPPALSYRFLSSLITSWDIKNYKEGNKEKRMLFSDLAVVNIDGSHDVAVQVKTNRVIVSLIHAKKKENIIPTLASSLQECMTAAIARISEFYSILSGEAKQTDANSGIPFTIEFGVFCNSDICFFGYKDMPLSSDKPLWYCTKHKKQHETKCLTAWFSEKEPCDVCKSSCKGLGRLERGQHPFQHHIGRLATQLSLDDCREIVIMLGSSAQEWNDLEYQFQHQPPNDLKFTALWSSTTKIDFFTFGSLQKVLKKRDLSKHLLCQVFRDARKNISDMPEDTLNSIPSVDALCSLSNHIGNSIMQLAIELGVDICYIQQIQHDYKNKLLEQTKYLLMKWRQNKFPKPTVERLLKALHRVGKYGSAYKVLRGYF
ncbi:unnamed protein product [Mytilus coruscus]|uniref:Death domain-containing protein n=1 Tax=Mytilus coruscus TaxID=42192 RepID=A0A6J8BAV0_MYTCO|nr:unnamed protein product [Mytilus coruscus]